MWNNSHSDWLQAVVQSLSRMSDSLWPHGLWHARPSCPSPTPRACSNSCPLSQWCHQTIASSVIPFSSRLQSFPASGSFPMSQFFTSGGQIIGVSASASVLPMNIQEIQPVQRILTSLTWQLKSINSLVLSLLYGPTLTPLYADWKNYSFTTRTFVGKVMFLKGTTILEVWCFLKKLNILSLYNPAIMFLGIYPKELKT